MTLFFHSNVNNNKHQTLPLATPQIDSSSIETRFEFFAYSLAASFSLEKKIKCTFDCSFIIKHLQIINEAKNKSVIC